MLKETVIENSVNMLGTSTDKAEKILCFQIADRKLYLEKILVEYNHIPVFFVCSDGIQRYLVLCTNTENYSYLVTEIHAKNLAAMLGGKSPIRNAFLDNKYCWEIATGNTASEDKVIEKSSKYIDRSHLPDRNAVFKLIDPEIEEYAEKLST